MSRRQTRKYKYLVFSVKYWKSWTEPNIIYVIPRKIYRKSVTKGTNWKFRIWLKNKMGDNC